METAVSAQVESAPLVWRTEALKLAAMIRGLCGPASAFKDDPDQQQIVALAERIIAEGVTVRTEAPNDSELLDWLESHRTKGRKVRLVNSGLGKGWRLHETDAGYDSVREALTACVRPEQAGKLERA